MGQMTKSRALYFIAAVVFAITALGLTIGSFDAIREVALGLFLAWIGKAIE